MRHVPLAGNFGIWGDDLLGYGKPDDRKKWWLDLEDADGELRILPSSAEKKEQEVGRGKIF